MKRLDYEVVKECYARQECELLDTFYTNCSQRLNFRCKCGKVDSKTYAEFKKRPQCRHCSEKIRAESRKIPVSEVLQCYKDNGCELLDPYVTCTTKVKYRCKCGEVHQKTFDQFKRSHRCKKCRYIASSAGRRKAFEEVKSAFANAGLTLLEIEYKNSSTLMKCRCKCGREFETFYSTVQQGGGSCPACAGNEKYTYDQVKTAFEEAGCVLLSSDYESAHGKLEYICSCGGASTVCFANFRHGNRCKQCQARNSAERQREDFDYVKAYFDKAGCRLLEVGYINGVSPLRYVCICGEESVTIFRDFRRGRRCKRCGVEKNREATIKRGGKRFFKVAPLIHSNKYDYGEVDYQGSWVRVKIRCPKHGAFMQHPYIHLRGCGCQKCNESSGERRVSQVLSELGLKYVSQAKFETCKNKKNLPFDFLVKVDEKKGFLIEYQGIHHYQAFKYGGMTDDEAEKKFECVRNNDGIKEKWCKDRGIALLVIPYWDKLRIKQLVEDFLKEVRKNN